MSKYLNIHYWIRKFLTDKFFSKFFNQEFISKAVFNSIFKSNHWNKGKNFNVNTQSYSGPGSVENTAQTNYLLSNLKKFFIQYDIKKILDAPCGDCAWIKNIFGNDLEYTGIDIVEDLIRENKFKFKSYKNVNFYCEDLNRFNNYEKYDFVLLRDFFIHLPLKNILEILKKLENSNCKFFAFNNYESIENNKDISFGQHRKINVFKEPFNFNKPYLKIAELTEENKSMKIKDNFIYIYKNKT